MLIVGLFGQLLMRPIYGPQAQMELLELLMVIINTMYLMLQKLELMVFVFPL
jgi:hypothetical protein